MKKILLVFGTRPEAIKMAPLVKAFQASDKFETKVCVTAQHREMLDQVLALFQIVPDFDLDIMKPGQDLFDVTINVLNGIKKVISEWSPDFLFVHGDTATSMASCLAGFYTHTKVAHIEAGLRTYNLDSPWPEEGNRQITGRLANLHFAPTEMAGKNLLSEGTPKENILVTGNTVIDALMWVLKKVETEGASILEELKSKNYIPGENTKKILVTGHRRENFGGGFIEICKALKTIAENNPSVEIIYPVHLNPNVRKPVFELLSGITNIHLIAPLDYRPFAYLMSISDIVLTDSGGIQEEAPSLGKPVLVMRDTTERPEAVDAGTVKLIGTDSSRIIKEVEILLNDKNEYLRMSKAHNPYGDGLASQRIVEFLENY